MVLCLRENLAFGGLGAGKSWLKRIKKQNPTCSLFGSESSRQLPESLSDGRHLPHEGRNAGNLQEAVWRQETTNPASLSIKSCVGILESELNFHGYKSLKNVLRFLFIFLDLQNGCFKIGDQ